MKSGVDDRRFHLIRVAQLALTRESLHHFLSRLEAINCSREVVLNRARFSLCADGSQVVALCFKRRSQIRPSQRIFGMLTQPKLHVFCYPFGLRCLATLQTRLRQQHVRCTRTG